MFSPTYVIQYLWYFKLYIYTYIHIYIPVLLNGGHGGAMAVFHGGFAKKRHRIAVAWRVWDGGAMAAAIAMAVVAGMCFCDGYAGSDGKSNDGDGDDFHCSCFSR